MTTLSDACYAYAAAKKYPIHTKEAALNSYAEFCTDINEIPCNTAAVIQEQFKKAAQYHGIELTENTTKQAAAQDLVSLAAGDGVVVMSKIATADDVTKAAAFIVESRENMTREQLKEASRYVFRAAVALDTDISTDNLIKVAQIAGFGVGDREDIQNELCKRATMNILSAQDSEIFWKYASDVASLSDDDFYKEETLNKICSVIEDIDSVYACQHKYGASLRYPEEVCFGTNLDTLLKEASDMAYIPSIDTVISKKALDERSDKANAFFSEYFGQESALSGEDLVDKIASLDQNTATALLEAIE